MQKRCIKCLQDDSHLRAIGGAFSQSTAPKWVKVCYPHFQDLQSSSSRDIFALSTHLAGIEPRFRREVPFCVHRCSNYYSRATVSRVLAEQKTWLAARVDLLTEGYSGQKQELREGLTCVNVIKGESPLFDGLIARVTYDEEADPQELEAQLTKIVLHHRQILSIKDALARVRAASSQDQANVSKYPLFSSKFVSRSATVPDTYTWLEAILHGPCSLQDYISFQDEYSLAQRLLPFREKDQACRAKMACDKATLACGHKACGTHHGPLCEAVLQGLVAKVQGSADLLGKDHCRRISSVEDAIAAVRTGKDKEGRKQELLRELADCRSENPEEIVTAVHMLHGLPRLDAEVMALRLRHKELCTKWHISLDDTLFSCWSGPISLREAVKFNIITAKDIIEYELDRLQESKVAGLKSALRLNFRDSRQACAAYVRCETKPILCVHNRCLCHHHVPCRKAAKVKEATENKHVEGDTGSNEGSDNGSEEE